MNTNLDAIEKRFDELTQRLMDPAVSSNPSEIARIGKERAEIEPLVEKYRAMKKSEAELDGVRELLKSDDPSMRDMAKDEAAGLEARIGALRDEITELLLPRDRNDGKNVMLEIRGGAGGEESALFAAELFRMYNRFAETHRWKVETLSMSVSGLKGIKEVIAQISGKDVYSHMKYESGVHRVQRVPDTEASGRIHTSTATVAVLPEADEVDVKIDDKDLNIDVYRAGGPGGQGVNTTDSAVRITHTPTGLVVVCQDERSQHKNKARALKILRARLFEIEREKQDSAIRAQRRSQVGTGDRSEKIRTYNFPQSRVTDHRIGFTTHRLAGILDGDLDELVTQCRTFFRAEALKESDQPSAVSGQQSGTNTKK
ncbi:MAG: peptide chain release factor 1 [Deltaproteobacteria bacterium]|nr:peptide chain release factor 1 [Deltaproteobacteria bacterium]